LKVRFLGTAGSLMSEQSSYPAILVNDEVLLDCGEGTTQKLIQINVIEKIKLICITHLHNDHFMGIFSLLWHLWIKKHKKSIEIVGPVGLKRTIETILELVNTPEDLKSFEIVYTELKSACKTRLKRGEFIIESVSVEHGMPARAYLIQNSHKSICYTGDSKPTKNLEYLAETCDLLICESTLPTQFKSFAHQHFHMTPEDAANLAVASSAKKLLLFHISSYFVEQVDEFKNQAEKIFKKEVMIAHDNMLLLLDT
jgi:ribonuclease Z